MLWLATRNWKFSLPIWRRRRRQKLLLKVDIWIQKSVHCDILFRKERAKRNTVNSHFEIKLYTRDQTRNSEEIFKKRMKRFRRFREAVILIIKFDKCSVGLKNSNWMLCWTRAWIEQPQKLLNKRYKWVCDF